MRLLDFMIGHVQEAKQKAAWFNNPQISAILMQHYFKGPVLCALVVSTVAELNLVGVEFALRTARNVLAGGSECR